MFYVDMDIVSSEERIYIPSELYDEDLVIMGLMIEELVRRVAEWRVILIGKGVNVNVSKSKVIVGSNGGKMIVHSGDLWSLWDSSTGKPLQVYMMTTWIHK